MMTQKEFDALKSYFDVLQNRMKDRDEDKSDDPEDVFDAGYSLAVRNMNSEIRTILHELAVQNHLNECQQESEPSDSNINYFIKDTSLSDLVKNSCYVAAHNLHERTCFICQGGVFSESDANKLVNESKTLEKVSVDDIAVAGWAQLFSASNDIQERINTASEQYESAMQQIRKDRQLLLSQVDRFEKILKGEIIVDGIIIE